MIDPDNASADDASRILGEVRFSVTFDGPAIRSGTMPVRRLAPALIHIEKLIGDAAGHVMPLAERPVLSIESAREGSLIVSLVLSASDAWTTSRDALVTDTTQALLNLWSSLMAAGTLTGGLLWMIRKLRGGKPQRVEVRGDIVLVVMPDGSEHEVSRQVYDLYIRPEIRRRASDVLQPIRSTDVDLMRFTRGDEVGVQLSTDDIPAFDLAADGEEIEMSAVQEMLLQLHVVDLDAERKWRVSNGAQEFAVTIEDEAFSGDVTTGALAFRQGDAIRCMVRVEQRLSGTRLMTSYAVVEVLAYLPGGQQLELGDGGGET